MEAKTRARNWICRFRHVDRPAFAVFAEQRDLSLMNNISLFLHMVLYIANGENAHHFS